MRRGEIWTVSGGSGYAGKARPSLVVQDDLFAETRSVTICGFTTENAFGGALRPFFEPSIANGLSEPSWLMIDKITTVPRGRAGRRIGRLEEEEMGLAEAALIVFLGLAVEAR
jgi:mRNA interferase MazF